MAKREYGPCLVCGEVAIGFNFGVPTCMPCKAFFRRNAVKLGVRPFVCLADGDCQISSPFQRSCNCCRLAKCFRVGMDKSLILSTGEREARNKLVEDNRLRRGKLPKQKCAKWLVPSTTLMPPPKPVISLSPSDQVVLANLLATYESSCIAPTNARFPTFPTTQHTSIPAFLNECSALFPIFVEYFKHIPEFVSIDIQDRVRLIKNHCGIVISVNESLLHPVPSSNLIVSWTNVFGMQITRLLLQRQKVMEPFTHDPVLLKILLIVLVFSCNQCRSCGPIETDDNYADPKAILTAQNVYVELLWRYILSRSAGLRNAVKFWNKLILCVLHTFSVCTQMDEFMSSQTREMPKTGPLIQNMWPRGDPPMPPMSGEAPPGFPAGFPPGPPIPPFS